MAIRNVFRAAMRATAALLGIWIGFSSDPVLAGTAPGKGICERYVAIAARSYDVPIGVLYAVGLTESGLKGGLYPYAMNIEGEARFPKTVEDALRQVKSARRSGARLIDVGCMQINMHYHRAEFSSDRAMFDPRTNVMYAAAFLKKLKTKHNTWSMAVARYHAGPDNDPAQKRYVCRVIGNMVSVGMGQWTDNARAFCN